MVEKEIEGVVLEDVEGLNPDVDVGEIEGDVENVSLANSEDGEDKKEEEKKLTDIPGIGPGIASKLEAAGVYDLMGLAVLSPASLSDMAGVGEAVARKAIQAARGLMSLGFVDGIEFSKKREDVCYISTGSNNLNELLGGKGVETKAMTEAYGAFGSGKCVSKDTMVSYFNDTRMHVESIEETYNKYKEMNSEQSFEEGFVVPVSTVKVLAWLDGKMKVVNASNLYKEKVQKLFVVKTKRGRVLKVTGKHQLLSFENGVNWKKVGLLNVGDLIASPKEIDLTTESVYDEDDGYFLGLFAAEGTANPFSITTGSTLIKDWLCKYIENKFGYFPRVRQRQGKSCVNYCILLRNGTREMMDGLDRSNASTKCVPEGIFLSSKSVVSSFLGGYLDGDGEVAKSDVSATTKSKKLATQLTYLLLRLGISTSVSDKVVEGSSFKIVRVSGEDREKLKGIGFKLKSFDCSVKNSSYGYPRNIVSFIGKLYGESIGGNRGNLRKSAGKISTKRSTAYMNLTGSSNASVINSSTLDGIEKIFLNQKDEIIGVIRKLESENFSLDLLKKIYPKLPFAFNSLSRDVGVSKSTMRNYYLRAIPESKGELLRNLILNELRARVDRILLAISVIAEIRLFNWDVIESVEVVDYDDYVYDFVVPEGHSFVGGNIPTMMHNSQLGFTLAVNVQLPKNQGGAGGKAVLIDTEGTFRPDRIKQLAEGIGANPEKVLKNILVARAFNSDHQILLIDKIGELIKDGEDIKLVVIDSLTAHFRAEFSGRGQLADRQQKLNRYLHNLIRLAEQHNLAIFVTNQVMANPGMMFGDPTTAVGGNILGHACLTGDSLIQLADGEIIEIKNIGAKRVFSGDFNKMSFEGCDSEQLFVNPDVDSIYNIKTNSQINCSGLHRFFCVDDFEVTEREAKNLNVGDFVAQAKRIEISGEDRKIPEFKIKRIGKITKKSAERVKEKLSEANVSREEICKEIGITPRQFRRVLNQEYPTSFNVLDNLNEHFKGQQLLQILPVVSGKHRNLNIPEFLDFKLAQIFGYFWGDGNFEEFGLRFRDERYDVLEVYGGMFKQLFNIDCAITKMRDKNCYTLNVHSKGIRGLFELMLPSILGEIGKSKNDVIAGFIKGFFDAEGHINKKMAYVSAVQKEGIVLKYLQLFLLRLGIRSTIKFGIGMKKINVLRIIDKDVENYLKIGFTAKDKQKTLIERVEMVKGTYSYEMMPVRRDELRVLFEGCGLRYSNVIKSRPKSYQWISRRELEKAFGILMSCEIRDRQVKQKVNFIFKLLNGDIAFERIRDISILKNNGQNLYDFSVPKNENYLANGFVVHNSTYRLYLRRGKAGSRVAKLIDSPNLPDNETQFYLTQHGVRDEELSE